MTAEEKLKAVEALLPDSLFNSESWKSCDIEERVLCVLLMLEQRTAEASILRDDLSKLQNETIK